MSSFADDQAISRTMPMVYRPCYEYYQRWKFNETINKTERMQKTLFRPTRDITYHKMQIFRSNHDSGWWHWIWKCQNKIRQSRKLIGALIYMIWTNRYPKVLSVCYLKSQCCKFEIWIINADLKKRLNNIKPVYLRRSAGVVTMSKTRNKKMKRILKVAETAVFRIEKRVFIWFGHLLKMPEER